MTQGSLVEISRFTYLSADLSLSEKRAGLLCRACEIGEHQVLGRLHNPVSILLVSLLYLQGHVGASKCNERAIRNCCKDGKLQTRMMLIFRQMPSCQQSPKSPTRSEQLNLVPRWLVSAPRGQVADFKEELRAGLAERRRSIVYKPRSLNPGWSSGRRLERPVILTL